MQRPAWKGNIVFGLVNVPVSLYSAEERTDLSFKLIDSRNAARVRYERVNEESGEEVPWDKIVKGYEYEDGNFVLLSDKEFEAVSPELTKLVEIEQFVSLEEVDVRYFDRPYYLVPTKIGQKGYVLLRDAMSEAEKIGIARVVIRSRQHLAALMPYQNALVLELLRFPHELRSLSDYDFPSSDHRQHKVSRKEIDLAAQLIEGMTSPWDPDAYRDEYREAVMKMINKKVASGKTEAIESPETPAETSEEPTTINFMDVLKRSMQQTTRQTRSKKKPRRAATKTKSAPRKRTTKKKRAG